MKFSLKPNLHDLAVESVNCSLPRCDEPHRAYQAPGDGKLMVSVTEALGWAYGKPFPRAAELAAHHAADRGKEVHKACHLVAGAYPGKKLRMQSLDDETGPRVEGYIRFVEWAGWKCQAAEIKVFSPTYRVAGTLDQLGGGHIGDKVLIDLKATLPHADPMIPGQVGPQTAGYAMGIREHYDGWLGLRRFALYLHPDLKYGYRLVPMTSTGDYLELKYAVGAFYTYHQKLGVF